MGVRSKFCDHTQVTVSFWWFSRDETNWISDVTILRKNAKIFACHHYMDVIFWNKDIELNYHHLRFKAVFHPMAFYFTLPCVMWWWLFLSPVEGSTVSPRLLSLPEPGLCERCRLLRAAHVATARRGRIQDVLCSGSLQGMSVRGGNESVLSDREPDLPAKGIYYSYQTQRVPWYRYSDEPIRLARQSGVADVITIADDVYYCVGLQTLITVVPWEP